MWGRARANANVCADDADASDGGDRGVPVDHDGNFDHDGSVDHGGAEHHHPDPDHAAHNAGAKQDLLRVYVGG
jgi:hypothetical protein